jgi:3-methyladenine DNA glycosylase AlkD
VTGAWWDLVDELAHAVGAVLRAVGPPAASVVREWSRDEDLWLRRVAILSQLGARARTDPVLLADCIAPNLADRAFFIRKAIGWALRDYARTDPAWVAAFVLAAGDRLSPLSRREATKHLRRRLGTGPADDLSP